jgi:hypothetical protein
LGFFREFRAFLTREAVVQAATDLDEISADVVRPMARQIPKEWEVSPAGTDALIDLIPGEPPMWLGRSSLIFGHKGRSSLTMRLGEQKNETRKRLLQRHPILPGPCPV